MVLLVQCKMEENHRADPPLHCESSQSLGHTHNHRAHRISERLPAATQPREPSRTCNCKHRFGLVDMPQTTCANTKEAKSLQVRQTLCGNAPPPCWHGLSCVAWFLLVNTHTESCACSLLSGVLTVLQGMALPLWPQS